LIEGDSKENSSFFPQLLWVLRDFTLNLGSKTSNEYLESCLSKVDGHGDDVE